MKKRGQFPGPRFFHEIFLRHHRYLSPLIKELRKEKSPPENRTASNDCLPYKKRRNYLVESTTAEESTTTAEESTITGAVVVSTVTSVSVSVVSGASLHATNAPIANTNKNFFIVPCFVFLGIIWC